MSLTPLNFLELNFPLLVLGCAAYTLLTINFANSPMTSTKYALLGIVVFAIRLPMIIHTPLENHFGRGLILVLAAMSGLFFLIALMTGTPHQFQSSSDQRKK